MPENLEVLVRKAVSGDKSALEQIVIDIKDMVYNLSLRMLWNPADAEDASQEILIKVITSLSKFQGNSKFTTWVYKIASNHLMNTKKSSIERQGISFEVFKQGIYEGFGTREKIYVSEVDRGLLAEELKISCTHAMLLCLDREQRMIYILSTMFKVKSNDGACIMNITPEAYRKRLSRTREKMKKFMESSCGLVNGSNLCRCNKRVEVAIENGRINPGQLIFAANMPVRENSLEVCREEMEEFDKVSAVFNSNPYYMAPESILESIKGIVLSDKYKILNFE